MKKSYNLTLTYPWLPVDQTSAVHCAVCDGKSPAQAVFSFLLNTQIFEIRRCTIDHLMFLSPQPGDRYIDALYNHRSYSTGEDDMYGLKIDDEKSANIARIRLDEILKYQQSTGNFLEIGCGGGHTLLEARKRGFQVQGIEIAQSSIALCRAKGLDVLDISYNALDSLPPNTYAVVALYSVLEHTKNPVNFLEQLLPSLKKDGLLVIRVPNMTKEGPWLSLLDHFWHFESGVLKNILTSFGLIVVDAFPSGIFHGTIHRGTLESVTFVCRKS